MPQRKPLSTYEQGLLRSYLDNPDLLSIEDRDEGSRIAQTYLKTGAGDRAKAPQGRGTFDRPLMQSFQSLVRSNRPVVPKTTPEQRAANEAAAVKAQEGWSPVRRAFAEVPGAVVNFGKGLTVSDLLDPDIRDWSNAEKAGALLSGVVPLMAVPKKIVGAGRKLVMGMPEGLGTLARTLTRGRRGSPYALKPSVVDRLAEFHRQGAGTGAKWDDQIQEVVEGFGGDVGKAREWARIWGATSPNTSVPRNTAESVSALHHAETTGRAPMTLEGARSMDPKITMAGSKVPNINRAMLGDPLSGDKVEAMSGFMVGDERIPIDVHTLYGVGATGDKLTPELPGLRAAMTKAEGLPLRGSLTDTDIYLRYEGAIRDALASFGEGGQNKTFAQVWDGIRKVKGLKGQGGPVDILRRKGLLKSGAMLDPEQLKDSLRLNGWTAGMIAALTTGIAGSATRDGAHQPELQGTMGDVLSP